MPRCEEVKAAVRSSDTARSRRMASERRGRSRERSVEIIESRTGRDANPRVRTSRPRAPSHERAEESTFFSTGTGPQSVSVTHVLEERVVISCWFSKLLPERPSMTD